MEPVRQYFPDVYVLSKLPALPEDIKRHLPDGVKVITVPGVTDLWLDKDKIIEIPEETKAFLRDVEVLITESNCLATLLYELPNIKWVQTTFAGVDIIIDNLDLSKPMPNFILTKYGDDYFGELVANYVLAQIINIERKFFYYHDVQKLRQWSRPRVLPNFRVLKDLTVGVLGAGMIGSRVGNLLKKVGCRVIAFARSQRSGSSENYDECVADLESVLKESDYICNILPSTRNTRGLLDNDVLRICEKKPVFINVGRGDIIRNSTVVNALRKGWISGAVLDVFEAEPLPPDSELWTIPEVHITPHIGAMPKCEGVAQFFADNYLSYVKGGHLRNIVNWKNGY